MDIGNKLIIIMTHFTSKYVWVCLRHIHNRYYKPLFVRHLQISPLLTFTSVLMYRLVILYVLYGD